MVDYEYTAFESGKRELASHTRSLAAPGKGAARLGSARPAVAMC
jgi:hypothetical protein